MGEAVAGGRIVAAISLDIKNTFNSIPWSAIRRAIQRKGFPAYLVRIISAYLSDRWICFPTMNGPQRRRVCHGVPQGSVLGPLLWNITFDKVLRTQKDPGSWVVCYADDTLILVENRNIDTVMEIAQDLLSRVLNNIKVLGFSVAQEKTEAILFGYHNRERPVLRLDDFEIEFKSNIKYLGVILDNRWSFEPHFRYVATKVTRVGRALLWLDAEP